MYISAISAHNKIIYFLNRNTQGYHSQLQEPLTYQGDTPPFVFCSIPGVTDSQAVIIL